MAAEDLNWRCDAASGCSSQWKIVSTGDFNRDGNTDVLWHNPNTGVLSVWLLNSQGIVIGTQTVGSIPPPPPWRVVGAGDFNRDGNTDVLWHNPNTGVLSAWLLDSQGNVIRTQDLDWRCDAASGCSSQWTAVGITDRYYSTIR
jgi:hypothetical protein